MCKKRKKVLHKSCCARSCASCVSFSPKKRKQPLSVRRGVNLTCDVTLSDKGDWGPPMRDSQWTDWMYYSGTKHNFHDARYLNDSKCDEGMPDMDPPEKPKRIVNLHSDDDSD